MRAFLVRNNYDNERRSYKQKEKDCYSIHINKWTYPLQVPLVRCAWREGRPQQHQAQESANEQQGAQEKTYFYPHFGIITSNKLLVALSCNEKQRCAPLCVVYRMGSV